jgi:uncharacterized protein DUF5916/cellulose/xylan binding protein with CBM9 domain
VRSLVLVLITGLTAPQTLFAQTSEEPPDRAARVTQAARVGSEIRIDGRLDESEWSRAAVTDSFIQVEPDEGTPATQRTEVRVLYDEAFLYIGATLHDAGRITGRLGRRDMDAGDSDWFRVFLDSYHDHRTAFGFEINPVGVRRDEIRTIDTDDNTWEPVWDAEARIDSAGWTAEIRIPFRQLRFSGAREQTWGVQFERAIGRNHENVLATFIPKSESGGVPFYGHLTGLEEIRPGRRFEVLPYALGRSSFVDPGPDPFRPWPDHSAAAGLDVLYGIGSNLTLNAAFNPDFGQVEVDPAVVNLGVYETFFEEKRPFFIEGSEIFDFGADGTSGGQIFYSRRIGRAPTLAPPSFESDVPDATTILGAGKLSGKPGGWSVGALEAVTAKEDARYRAPGISDGRFAVEPLSNYLVARARREARGGQSIVGGIVTAVHRDLVSDALTRSLHSAAYAGGVDFRREWGHRMWAVYGDAELSHVQGTARAITVTQRRSNHFFQRPDATHLEVDSSATSLTGYSINVQARKQGGLHWRGRIGTALTSPRYEVNDLGFSFRTDRRDFQADLTYLQNRPGTLWRRWNVTGTGRLERNFAWQPILSYASIIGSGQTKAYWTPTFQVTRYFRAYDDRLTRGGPLAIRPAWWAERATLSSDGRKAITASLNLGGDHYESGGWDWNVGLAVGIKSSTRWNLTVRPTVGRVSTPAQFVTSVADSAYAPTYGRRYVFAPLHQTSVGLETRFNMTFTPRLSLETYVQPLLSSADYGDPRQLIAAKTYDFEPFGAPVPDLDFNLRSLRGNAVLRWEWRAGSALYVAWQQRRSDIADAGDFDFARDRSALFGTRPDNTYLVKVNYWWSP